MGIIFLVHGWPKLNPNSPMKGMAGFAIDMVVAIVRARRPMGASFGPTQSGIGWEFEFILAAAALTLLFTGAGSIALDPVVGL